MTRDDLIVLARAAAARHELFGELFCGLVERESTWDPWKIRYEHGFYARYVQKQLDSGALIDMTEARARAFSWGLCQVMGEEARERGYTGHLAELCDPATGLEIGAVTLAHKMEMAGGDVARALELYNGGSNPNYAAEVLELAKKYEGA
jgi:soluble lytic murein transglycosylase-like protein